MKSSSSALASVDACESREAADRLVQDSIGPVAASLRLSLPDLTEFEVHNLLTSA